MPYVSRDEGGAINGTFAREQPGFAEEYLPDDDPEVVAFLDAADAPPPPSLAEQEAARANQRLDAGVTAAIDAVPQAEGGNTRLSTLVHLNGSTDYVEGFVRINKAFNTIPGGILTSFSSALVQPEVNAMQIQIDTVEAALRSMVQAHAGDAGGPAAGGSG